MQNQFIREAMLLGRDAPERLQGRHVMVFGIGGVGGHCAEALARSGVGFITVVDHDTVGVTNLNRQIIALHSTLGQNKADLMARRILDINPECHVVSLPLFYQEQNKEQFFTQPVDYIVDAVDTVSSKLSLIETAKARSIPIISAMGTGNKLDPTLFQITDIAKTTLCPLARVVRKELRARGIYHHTVLYSTEAPRTPEPLEAPPPGRRSLPASVAWVPSCAGLMMAGYVVQALLAADAPQTSLP